MSGKPVQLTLDGEFAVPSAKPRAGAIGKVERALDERPWLSCCEIAKAVNESPDRVSSALNKLKHEGRAQAEDGVGPRGGMVWASPESAASAAGIERLADLRAALRDKRRAEADEYHAKLARKHLGAEAGEVDWRPSETIPEDHYAL